MNISQPLARQIIFDLAPFGVSALMTLPFDVFESAGWALCGDSVVENDEIGRVVLHSIRNASKLAAK
jgi:hypothetical protein